MKCGICGACSDCKRRMRLINAFLKLDRKEIEMFHAKNGWYFERTVDGGVHIVKKATAYQEAPVIAELYIDHPRWSSIISSVSCRGETSESFREAEIFHGRNLGGVAATLPESYDDAGIEQIIKS